MTLLQQGKVEVVASDGHNARARPPKLGAVYRHISRAIGEREAMELLVLRPAKIAASQF